MFCPRQGWSSLLPETLPQPTAVNGSGRAGAALARCRPLEPARRARDRDRGDHSS